MPSVEEHYDRHLGRVYTWMVGDTAAALQRSRDEFRRLGLSPGKSAVALDLGAGPGLHAIPLAEIGFSVIAFETCTALAEELRERTAHLPIRVIDADLATFRRHCPGPVDAIVCMGDTLTHLPSLAATDALLRDIAEVLAAPGIAVFTFRDYHSAELRGDDRFIPVRSDGTRILTCFLEYFDETVVVHDLMHERINGGWRLSASSYPKLRIDPAWVLDTLGGLGLVAERDSAAGGMVRVVARRPVRSMS